MKYKNYNNQIILNFFNNYLYIGFNKHGKILFKERFMINKILLFY